MARHGARFDCGQSAGQAQEQVKIGVLAALSGARTSGGEDGVRGAQVALEQRGGKIAGR